MAITDKLDFQWIKQSNGILRILALVLSIVILVLVHTILSEYVIKPTLTSGIYNVTADKTFDSDFNKNKDSRGKFDDAEPDQKVPVFIMNDNKMSFSDLISGMNDQPMHGMNFIDVVSAGNIFAIAFFLLAYITGESVAALRLTTEVCFDVVHAILNAVAGAFLMYRRDHPLLNIEDQPSMLITGIMFLVLTGVLVIDLIFLVTFQKVTQDGGAKKSLIASINTPSV